MHSVREFATAAFEHARLGEFERYVEIDPRCYRPTEVDALQGDPTKAKRELGWEPEVGFDDLVQIMVEADIAALEAELAGTVTRYSHEGADERARSELWPAPAGSTEATSLRNVQKGGERYGPRSAARVRQVAIGEPTPPQ